MNTALVILAGLVAIVVVLMFSDADAAYEPVSDSTPYSCDGKPMSFHVKRSRALIRKGYSPDRVPDRSPAKVSERLAWQRHKRCISFAPARFAISEYRKRKAKAYERKREKRALAVLYERLINPPGASWLAALRACEASGNYATNTGNGFYGAYQFDSGTWASTEAAYRNTGWPEPPVSPASAASPRQQDIRASILYRSRGGQPWPNCP